MARDQALRAYRASLDFFYDTVWYQQFGGGEIVPLILRDRVGLNLVDPASSPDRTQTRFGQADLDLVPLFGSVDLAREEMGEWGYAFDVNANTTTFFVPD